LDSYGNRTAVAKSSSHHTFVVAEQTQRNDSVSSTDGELERMTMTRGPLTPQQQTIEIRDELEYELGTLAKASPMAASTREMARKPV
jgi:hypothetical protein